MSTAPLTAAPSPRVRDLRAARPWIPPAAAIAVILSIAGLFAITSTCLGLWSMWMTDPLKSIGGLVPIVSLALILRVWRRLDWEMDGTWWGLAILAATIALVHVRDTTLLELVLAPSWSITLPPYSVVAVAYAAGAVLLFGGMRLLRAAKFPVALMWFVNPVPHFFNRYIDLPLQHTAAVIARSFAHLLGQHLTPDQLSLMFTPKFGMFIAPGCNGIRGAITMGFIALVAGYLYRLRLRHWAALTLGALLLGYAFNFVRLCGLVLYYVAALGQPWLQNHAAMADYILGAALFFAATVLLFAFLLRWRLARDLRLPPQTAHDSTSTRTPQSPSVVARLLALVLLLALGSVSYARAIFRSPANSHASQIASFPTRAGEYTLQREWNETLATGQVVFHWAQYASGAGRPAISIGVSPTLGAHDTLICHAARGDEWIWHGPLQLATAAGTTTLSASLFNNGATQYLEAGSVCTGDVCGQSSTERRHFGLIHSPLATHDLLLQNPARPIAILLRAETPDAALSASDARALLTRSLADFLARADLAQFTKPYRQR
jgi:exosortase J